MAQWGTTGALFMIRGETEGEELQGDRHSCVGYILMQEAFITPENTKWDDFFVKSHSVCIRDLKN